MHEATVLHEAGLNKQNRRQRGLGYVAPKPHGPNTQSFGGVRKLISEREVAAADTERLQHLKSLEMSGQWAEWDHVRAKDLSWRQLFQGAISDGLLKFVQNAQQFTLPTDNRLQKYSKQLDLGLLCRLKWVNEQGVQVACGQPNPNLAHVLSGCQAARQQGRLTFRHDSVLLVLKQNVVPLLAALNRGDCNHNERLQWDQAAAGGRSMRRKNGVSEGRNRKRKKKKKGGYTFDAGHWLALMHTTRYAQFV